MVNVAGLRRWITRHIYLPASQWFHGEKLFEWRRILEETQYRPLRELQERQWTSLREALRGAYDEVVYYRQAFDEHGIHPARIHDPADFLKVPILTKSLLGNNFKSLQSTVPRGGHTTSETSGSTGTPVRVLHGRLFRSSVEGAVWRARSWWNIHPGDRVFALWGRPLGSRWSRWVAQVKNELNNIECLSLFDLSEEVLDRATQRLMKNPPDMIYGYVSGLQALGEYCQGTGRLVPPGRIKAVAGTAEIFHSFQRELLASVFGCPTIDVYGSSEFGSFADECPFGSMHIACENVYVEVLDDDGQPLGPGENGHITVTTLNNPDMPLIRYQLGDMGCLLEEPCRCGRTLPRMGIHTGKQGQMVRTSNGRIFSHELFNYLGRHRLPKHGRELKAFKVIQTGLDSFDIKIVPGVEGLEDVKAEFRQILRQVCGPEVAVHFEVVAELPASPTGKMSLFESLVGDQARDS